MGDEVFVFPVVTVPGLLEYPFGYLDFVDGGVLVVVGAFLPASAFVAEAGAAVLFVFEVFVVGDVGDEPFDGVGVFGCNVDACLVHGYGLRALVIACGS